MATTKEKKAAQGAAKDAAAGAAKKLRITLVRSPIACVPSHRATVKALGLRKLNAVVEHAASPAILGMVRTVSYLLDVEEL